MMSMMTQHDGVEGCHNSTIVAHVGGWNLGILTNVGLDIMSFTH